MSGDGPDSIPTSADPRSRRPVKKRATLAPASAQAAQLDALFAKPDREIRLPEPGSKRRPLAPPPEIVSNVQGSSAGAGSGEFHVYKAARRREYERLRRMDEELGAERAAADFEAAKRERQARDDEKTRRNREKRAKKRNRGKQQAKPVGTAEEGADKGDAAAAEKRGVVAREMRMRDADEDEHEETAGPGHTGAQPAQRIAAHIGAVSGLQIHDDD